MRALLASALFFSAMLSCERPSTQVVVVINSDMEPGVELRQVRVRMQREGATTALFERSFELRSRAAQTPGTNVPLGGFELPGTLAVDSASDDPRRLLVDVAAFLNEDVGNFTQRAIVPFQRETVVYLSMFLASRCRLEENRRCAAGEVCGPNGCQTIVRPVATTSPLVDASTTTDATVDAAPACVAGSMERCYDGVDNNCNGRVDEGCAPQSCARADRTSFGLDLHGTDPAAYNSHCSEESVTPAGAFSLGEGAVVDPGGETVEGVRVSPFRIDRYEVTVERFKAFHAAGMPAPPYAVVAHPGGALALRDLRPSLSRWPVQEPIVYGPDNRFCHWSPGGGIDRERHPINCIDWFTAEAFCVWDGGRLPTEAEWEYAARWLPRPESPPSAMIPTPRRFPWGDVSPISHAYCHANYDEPDCASARVAADVQYGTWVVTYTTNLTLWYRVFDLSGNVAEWTADVFAPYASGCASSRTDPLCARPAGSLRFAMRGGGYNSLRRDVRGAAREGVAWDTRERTRGFRCVRTP